MSIFNDSMTNTYVWKWIFCKLHNNSDTKCVFIALTCFKAKHENLPTSKFFRTCLILLSGNIGCSTFNLHIRSRFPIMLVNGQQQNSNIIFEFCTINIFGKCTLMQIHAQCDSICTRTCVKYIIWVDVINLPKLEIN